MIRVIIFLCVIVFAGCEKPNDVTHSGSLATLNSQGPAAPHKSSVSQPAEILSASVKVSPEMMEAELIQKGVGYLKAGNLPSAIKNFDESIKVNPNDPRGYLILGETYLRIKNFDRAIDTFRAAVKADPQNGSLYYFLAMAYGLKGDTVNAIPNAKKSAEIFKSNDDQQNFLKSVALVQGLSQASGQKIQ